MNVGPVILENNLVRLEPMTIKHFDALKSVGMNEILWKWTTNIVKSEQDLRSYIETALDEYKRKISLPFVTIDRRANRIVGSTRFGNIDIKNRRAEIGWTWINPDWQRSFINTNAKFLMLEYAFETWKCIRVELKTDVLNEKSRKAICRIGAREEGVLRNHVITDSGRVRDTVYYSIINSEWSLIKKNLQEKIENAAKAD